MTADSKILFGLDYPTGTDSLYSNVNYASGWCFHTCEPIEAIRLYVNQKFQSDGLLKYPRLDVALKHPDLGDTSLLSGFHCYFDYSTLVLGENHFDFCISTRQSEERVSRLVVKEDRPAWQKVTDVFIDVVGPCNLRCTMCPQGVLEKRSDDRSRGVMSVELFDRTLSYLQEQGYIGKYLNLYNWGDPLLHPQIGEILDICIMKHIKPIISTNLSFLPQKVRALAEHEVELLIVSLSGFSEQTYVRNHVGGNFQRVRQNLDLLKNDRGRVSDILVKYLIFKYNSHEVPLARAYCEDSGFQFGAYAGAIPSVESFFRYTADPEYRRSVEEFIDPTEINLRPARFCPQETSITLNHRTELELCCVSWNGGYRYRSSLFDTDVRQYLERKVKNEFCDRCLATGYSYYKHFGILRRELLSAAVTNVTARR